MYTGILLYFYILTGKVDIKKIPCQPAVCSEITSTSKNMRLKPPPLCILFENTIRSHR